MPSQARFPLILATLVLLTSGCEPPRELEDGQQLYDRFWEGVPRDAFGQNLDEPTVRDVRRVLRLPAGCVASFDRDSGMMFVRAPAEDLQEIDRKVVHSEPDWEGPVQLRLTASLWISKTAPPNPWDSAQPIDSILEGAQMIDRREVTAFLGVQAVANGQETQPLPAGVEDDRFDEDIVRSWNFAIRTSLADDESTLDTEVIYELRMPKPDEPENRIRAELRTQCLLALGQPHTFELGSIQQAKGVPGRVVLVVEATRVNPVGVAKPDDET